MKRITALFALLLGLVWVAAAGAGSSSDMGYDGLAGSAQGEVQSGGQLPHTGFGLTFVILAAVVIALLGLLLRRLARST